MIAYDPHVEALLARFPAYSQELAGTSCFLEPGGDLVALIPPDADVDASGAVMPGAQPPVHNTCHDGKSRIQFHRVPVVAGLGVDDGTTCADEDTASGRYLRALEGLLRSGDKRTQRTGDVLYDNGYARLLTLLREVMTALVDTTRSTRSC